MGKKLTKETVLDRFKNKHGKKYDYALFDKYNSIFDKIIIICPSHGKFEQVIKNHLDGKGCRKCAQEKSSKKQRDTLENFIQKAKKIHGERYTYDISIYGKNAHDKLDIKCHMHGVFSQAPNKHLRGSGCPICGRFDLRAKYLYKGTKENVMSGVYILRLFNENESFCKLGISRNIKNRITSIPYKTEVLDYYKLLLSDAVGLEAYFKKLIKKYNYKYKPLVDFCGKTECFNYENLSHIKLLLKIRKENM